MLSKKEWIWIGSLGLAVVAVGGTAYAISTRRKKPTTKKGKIGMDLSDLPPPPGEDEEEIVAMSPWEEEASLVAPVEAGLIDDPVERNQQAIGRGHPDEYILPDVDALESSPGLLGASKPKSWKVLDPLQDPLFAPEDRGVDFGPIGVDTTWPVKTKHSSRLVTSYRGLEGWYGYSGRAFKAKRESEDGEQRSHAGVDLFGYEEDIVIAPEDGTILTILPFNAGTWAVYLITPDRRVLNLGEVEKYSWREFDIEPGPKVNKGDPLARIGRQKRGSTMIHFEMYDASGISDEDMIQKIRNSEFRWMADKDHPDRLYDPTAYLLKAASRTYQQEHGILPETLS